MVNVDELNEDIKQFGMVVERVSQLPDIYASVQEQLDTSKKNLDELSELNEKIENKFDWLEVGIKDRLELVENNICSAIDGLKKIAEQNAEVEKKRFITLTVEVAMVFVIMIVNLIVK